MADEPNLEAIERIEAIIDSTMIFRHSAEGKAVVRLLKSLRESNRAAPAAAQLDADSLPPPNVYAHNDHITGNPTAYSRAKVEQIVAPYAERIRLLERELELSKAAIAGFVQAKQDEPALQPAQSIDTPEFRAMLAAVQGFDDGEPIFGESEKRIIAYIDGRTAGTASDTWISVTDRLPEVGELVLVYSPQTKYDHPGEVNITFDCIDPDADEPSWLNHNEHYEHFCCVAKPEGSVGPSEHAPYTYWKRISAPSLSGTEEAK